MLSLTAEYAPRVPSYYPQPPLNWIDHMHDRHIGNQEKLLEMVERLSDDGGRWRYEDYGGRWRFWSALPDYSELWKILTWGDITQEYPDSNVPIADYLKHLCRRYEGEVALASENIQRFAGPVPREKMLWHPQFCKRQAQVPAMTALAARGKRTEGTSFSDEVDGGHWQHHHHTIS